jgi:hypothetical protein
MSYMKNLSVVILSLCCFAFLACSGTAEGGGGGGEETGSGTSTDGGSGTSTVSVPLQVAGYTDIPKLHCWGTGLDFEAELNQSGIANMNVPYPPDIIECNPMRADGSYVVISNGVCSDYKFIAGDVEITTWSGLVDRPNYRFRVAADGTVTLTGEDITWLDCTDGEPPPTCDQQDLLAQFSGYETAFPEATPEITCWGEGINGTATDFDNGQANMTACAGGIICSVQIAPGFYSPSQVGICQDHDLVINGTTVSSGDTNASGSYNYSFTLNEDGTVTETSEQIPQVDCTEVDPPPGTCENFDPVNLEITLSGYLEEFPDVTPTVTCMGAGSTELVGGTGNMQVCVPAHLLCYVEFSTNNYSPNSNGVCDTHSFVANGTTITTGLPNPYGSYNYNFFINTEGVVIESGDPLPVYDCSDDPPPVDPPSDISCDLEVIYLGDYLSHVLYMTGGGVTWGDTFEPWTDAVDENGDPLTDLNGDTIADANGDPGLMLTVTDVYPDDFIVNMDMTGALQIWLVYQYIMPGEDLYINGVLLDQLLPNGIGSNNLSFTINEACEVVTEDTEDVDIIIDVP